MSENCVICRERAPHHHFSRYCKPCGEAVSAKRWKAIAEVRKAIRRGALRHPKLLLCVDCGRQAFDYDHRDYSRPLMVAPVCRRCNVLRGPASELKAAA